MKEQAINNLHADHAQILGLLPELEGVIAASQPGKQWDEAQAAVFERLSVLCDTVLAVHERKEDALLFPVLEAFLPTEVGPLAVLRQEHRELSNNATQMRAAGELLARGRTEPEIVARFQHFARTTIRMVRDHIYKEERVLFPMVARYLSADQDTRLLSEMQSLDESRVRAARAES